MSALPGGVSFISFSYPDHIGNGGFLRPLAQRIDPPSVAEFSLLAFRRFWVPLHADDSISGSDYGGLSSFLVFRVRERGQHLYSCEDFLHRTFPHCEWQVRQIARTVLNQTGNANLDHFQLDKPGERKS
jgi:hypothetical protein